MVFLIYSVFLITVSSVTLGQADDAAATCKVTKETNGCSVPLNLKFPFKEEFKGFCNKHDICYVCGTSNGWTRKQCDDTFYSDLKDYCKHPHNNTTDYDFPQDKIKQSVRDALKETLKNLVAGSTSPERQREIQRQTFKILLMIGALPYIRNPKWKCYHGAAIYYKGVQTFGEPSYSKDTKDYCKKDCAIKLGKP